MKQGIRKWHYDILPKKKQNKKTTLEERETGNKSRGMESATEMLIHIKKRSYLERKKMYIDTESESEVTQS